MITKEFTLNGRMEYIDYYDDSFIPTTRTYTREEIDGLIKQVIKREPVSYGITDINLYYALDKYDITGKSVAIMGSVKPSYEAICLAYDGIPTTIEYNKIICEDDRVKVMTVEEYNKNPIKFDAAFSISSFEHDGLGRYGDKLNPNGDIEAMAKMKQILKPDGILFLAIPVGKDLLAFNAHRIYGEHRLPMMLDDWEVLDSFGYNEGQLNIRHTKRTGCQPIFVLSN